MFSPEKREESQRRATCQVGEYQTSSFKSTDISTVNNLQTILALLTTAYNSVPTDLTLVVRDTVEKKCTFCFYSIHQTMT